jgi:hypothetical protein
MQTLKALAVGMPGIPAGFFEEYHDEGDNQLRLLHCQSAVIVWRSHLTVQIPLLPGRRSRAERKVELGLTRYVSSLSRDLPLT